MSFSGSSLDIFNLNGDFYRINYSPANNKNDLVEIKAISGDGKIAIITFKVTTFDNTTTEKIIKIDLNKRKLFNLFK